jgi:hypothetical protein
MVSLVLDVTERKEAEIALKQSEDRARFTVRLDDALRTIVDPDEVSRTASRVLVEQLRCDRALYAEMEADQDHCTVVGEYSLDLPSLAGTYRLSDFGADYVASVRANRPYIEHNAGREGLPPEERDATQHCKSVPGSRLHYSKAAGWWRCSLSTPRNRATGDRWRWSPWCWSLAGAGNRLNVLG